MIFRTVVYDLNTDKDELILTEEALMDAVENLYGRTMPVTWRFSPKAIGTASDFELRDGQLLATIKLEVSAVEDKYFTIGGTIQEDGRLEVFSIGSCSEPSWAPKEIVSDE